MLLRFKRLKLRRCLVPEGTFQLGSEATEFDEGPIRQIYLSAFEMAVHPVTNEDYRRFLKKTRIAPPAQWRDPLFSHPKQPVVGVNWHEASSYCEWLSDQTGHRLRLPTEAEWEKGARGGFRSADYPWGNDEAGGGYESHQGPLKAPRQVKQGKPNGYGLHDMVVNIYQWCLDRYDPDYYQNCPEVNPLGPTGGDQRSARGMSWKSERLIARVSERCRLAPYFRCDDFGFRWVRTF